MTRLMRVRDLIELQRRKIDVDPLAVYEEIGVRSFGKGVFHKDPRTGAEVGNKRIFEIRPGDLIFNNVFAWEGAVALATDGEDGKCGSHRFLTYTARAEGVDLHYLRWFFVSEPGRRLLGVASPGSAGRNRTLAIDRFEDLVIPLPDVGEQRRVVAALGRIAERRKAAQALAERAREVTGILPAALAHNGARLLSGVPRRGWREVTLGDVIRVAGDAVPVELDRSYPNVGVYSFGRGLFEKQPIDGTLTSAKTLYRIRAGQFIYSRLFAFEGAYTYVDERFDGYFVSNEFPVFDVDDSRLDVRFLAAYFMSPSVWAELAAGSKGLGLRRQRVHPERLLAQRIWLPPLDEQRAIGRTLDRVRRIGELRSVVRERLSALEASVLNRAFGGQL